MTVTIAGMEPKRGRQMLLTLSDGRTLLLDRTTLEESACSPGDTLEEEQLAALAAASELRRGKEYALYLLSLRDYSEAELCRKLREHGCREKAAEIAARMQETGLLNDEVYARRLVRDCRMRKYYSRRRTLQELFLKGIDKFVAEEALDEVDEAENLTDVQQALALLQKKRYNTDMTAKEWERGCQMLQRNGYDMATFREAVRLLTDGEDEQWGTGD